jgi:hypothetical protein
MYTPATAHIWYSTVLPCFRTLTFEIPTTTNLYYAADLFASSELQDLFNAVAKVEFPGFYWFRGVAHNRVHHPYFQMLVSLPNVEEVSFTMHTAGVTMSAFGEFEMVRLEAVDPIHAKERKVIHLSNLVDQLELDGLFALQQLRSVRIDYIECEITAFFTKRNNPVNVLKEFRTCSLTASRSAVGTSSSS